jgi:hypothetical protein
MTAVEDYGPKKFMDGPVAPQRMLQNAAEYRGSLVIGATHGIALGGEGLSSRGRVRPARADDHQPVHRHLSFVEAQPHEGHEL